MRFCSILLPFAAISLLIVPQASPQQTSPSTPTTRAQSLGNAPVPKTPTDSDQDGLTDKLEQSLLDQFSPAFMVAEHDCSGVPSEFNPGSLKPRVLAENGTIYGQVFPAKSSTPAHPEVEIHYYHLWRRDCGEHGHALDTEHVSTLVRASGSDPSSAKWKAIYWYAAAHENTVCDVSQVTRAAALKAQDHGASIWISPGKHASYLDSSLCQPSTGCGADACSDMVALHTAAIINLGEPDHPMNGSVFIHSRAWPLAGKMETTDFPVNPISRLEALPTDDIAWVNPRLHPAQGVIAVSSTTAQSLDRSGVNTTNAVSVAGQSTGNGLAVAGDSTDNALAKSYNNTTHALGTSARHVGSALHLTRKPTEPQPTDPPSPKPQP